MAATPPSPTPRTAATVSGYLTLITTVFLRLIKMIIAPLVFSTLVVGIAHMGDASAIGRIGLRVGPRSFCGLTELSQHQPD
jgi:Na+/H+-dicarboxylate symporter